MVFLLTIVGFVSYILLVLLSGVVLVDLWAWFVVPVFHLVHLDIPQALGISLLVGYLTKQIDTKKSDDKMRNKFVTDFLWALSTWGIGWIISKFL